MEIIQTIEDLPYLNSSLFLGIDTDNLPGVDEVLFEMDRFLIHTPNYQCVPVFLKVADTHKTYRLNVNLPINRDTIQFLIEYYSTRFFIHFSLHYEFSLEDDLIDLNFSDEILLQREPGNPIEVKFNRAGNVVIKNSINIEWCRCGHIMLPSFGQMHCYSCQYLRSKG